MKAILEPVQEDAPAGTEEMMQSPDLTRGTYRLMTAVAPSLAFPLGVSMALHPSHFQYLLLEDEHLQGHGSLEQDPL